MPAVSQQSSSVEGPKKKVERPSGNFIYGPVHKFLRGVFHDTVFGDVLGRTPRFRQSLISLKCLFSFLFSGSSSIPYSTRKEIVEGFRQIRVNVPCAHSFNEILLPSIKVFSSLKDKPGCIVEAGCFKGGGTAKLSLVAKHSQRRLYAFDSFEGLPSNDEPVAATSMGYKHKFDGGEYSGSLQEVSGNVAQFGDPQSCEYKQGWFSDTMPDFREPVAMVFCDVDLELSNKDCLKYLWPNLVSGGYFFSQDAHIPVVNELFQDETFWTQEVGVQKVPKFHRVTNRFGYFVKP